MNLIHQQKFYFYPTCSGVRITTISDHYLQSAQKLFRPLSHCTFPHKQCCTACTHDNQGRVSDELVHLLIGEKSLRY